MDQRQAAVPCAVCLPAAMWGPMGLNGIFPEDEVQVFLDATVGHTGAMHQTKFGVFPVLTVVVTHVTCLIGLRTGYMGLPF